MCMHLMCHSLSLNLPDVSGVGVVRGRCSVAQEPGGGASARVAGSQRGHAAGALCGHL